MFYILACWHATAVNSWQATVPRCRVASTLASLAAGGDSTHYGPLTTMTNLGKRNELHSQCGHRPADGVSRPLATPTKTKTRTQMELQLQLGWSERAPLAIQSAFRSFAACLCCAVPSKFLENVHISSSFRDMCSILLLPLLLRLCCLNWLT